MALWCNISNIYKTEKLHERVIGFIHSDYDFEYFILKKLNPRTLFAKRLENICIEIYEISMDYIQNI